MAYISKEAMNELNEYNTMCVEHALCSHTERQYKGYVGYVEECTCLGIQKDYDFINGSFVEFDVLSDNIPNGTITYSF